MNSKLYFVYQSAGFSNSFLSHEINYKILLFDRLKKFKYQQCISLLKFMTVHLKYIASKHLYVCTYVLKIFVALSTNTTWKHISALYYAIIYAISAKILFAQEFQIQNVIIVNDIKFAVSTPDPSLTTASNNSSRSSS